MVRKIPSLLLLLALAGSGLAGDWKSEAASFFGEKSDYRGARDYLEGVIGSLADEDKPVACGLLAFLYGRLGDRNSEYRRLGEYLEKYGALDFGFSFLPYRAQNDIILYLREWLVRYPWVLKIGFVESSAPPARPPGSSPPEKIILGLEMAGEAYYKLSDGATVLKGGLFRRGFNSVSIAAAELFREAKSYPLVLELKAGDLIVRRELTIDVRFDVFGVMRNTVMEKKNPQYELKMFFGDDLLAASRKSPASMPPMKIEVPPPTGVYDPFGPGYQNEPKIPNSVPILAIPAMIAELIKSLKKRDEIEPVPPVEMKLDILVPFKTKNAAGTDIEVRARLSLGMREIKFLSFAASKTKPVDDP